MVFYLVILRIDVSHDFADLLFTWVTTHGTEHRTNHFFIDWWVFFNLFFEVPSRDEEASDCSCDDTTYNYTYKTPNIEFYHLSFTSYARLSYSPLSVLTKTTSPFSMNNGTLILNPVSKTASLVALLTVSPLTAGSHSTI